MSHDKDYAANCLRKREYFRYESIAGMYPYETKDMVYAVISHHHTQAPLALFDGDVWHLLSAGDYAEKAHMDSLWIKRVIGTSDAYSEYPIKSTAEMNELLERLKK